MGSGEGPEKTERINRKIKDALSRERSRKHVALVQTFPPYAKIHTHTDISGGAGTGLVDMISAGVPRHLQLSHPPKVASLHTVCRVAPKSADYLCPKEQGTAVSTQQSAACTQGGGNVCPSAHATPKLGPEPICSLPNHIQGLQELLESPPVCNTPLSPARG